MILTEFFNVCNQYEDKIALVSEEKSLTFKELARKSDAVALTLIKDNVKKGDIIPILLERGLDAVCAILGILKSGAGFCFINTDYPKERVDFIIKDVNANLIINDLWMNALKESLKGDLPFLSDENDPAVVVYTSGSTGNPKGVCISYRAFLIALNSDALDFLSHDVTLSTASFSFIAIIIDLLMPLFSGATVHIASDSVRKDVSLLEKYSQENAVTRAFLSPQMAKVFLERADGLLQTIITGSERVRGIYSKKTKVINSYGASETCGPFSYFVIDHYYDNNTPIGFANNGSGILILDENNQVLKEGEAGEIYVYGQIANGYLNLPELTKQCFIKNPFSKKECDKILFKTNDIGRIGENGALEYVQRKDWMVKVRGFRVEPSEIESAMIRLAAVDQAVVKSFENALGETSLFAVYTASKSIAPAEVKKAIRGFLPEYMIPAFFEHVEKMPLNSSGKIDRKNMFPPDRAKFKSAYEAPTTPEEKKICAVFSEILGIEEIGIDDDFNFLGGDSISAAKAQGLLDSKIAANDILRLGTPRLLGSLKITEIKKAQAKEEWPLSFAEKQMAAEQNMEEKSTAYNINLAFQIKGNLEIDRLEAVFQKLLKRHLILRSYYPMKKGEFVHKIADQITIPLEIIKCKKEAIQGFIENKNTPFDIAKGPLLRWHLFDTEEGYVLHFCIHHIIMDGTSGDVFIGDLWKFYNGEVLSEIELNYLDFSEWQNKQGVKSEGKTFFEHLFWDGVPENEMPTHFVRPDKLPAANSDCVRIFKTKAIDETAKKYGVSSFSFMVAALGLTLGKYCGSEDVVIGTAMSGRTLVEQETMIGMFVNTLPLRLKPLGNLSLGDYLLETGSMVRMAKTHQTYPFNKIVSALAPDRNSSRSPIFDVMINYLWQLPIPKVKGLEIVQLPIKKQVLNMELVLEIQRRKDEFYVELAYSKDLYLDEIIENFMEQFEEILNKMMSKEKNTLLVEISELPKAQKQEILEDFAGEKTELSKGKTVVDLFIEKALTFPENKAVVFQEKTLSYAQLNAVTNTIAGFLSKEYRIAKGKVVGILINRSEMMPVCSLGVLKTGAAYLPIDPAYPSERLDYMLEDSKTEIVILDKELEEKIPNFKGKILYTHEIMNLPKKDLSFKLPSPEDLLILLYTSGTTGNPKGVMLLHQGVANYVLWYAKTLGIKESDHIPAYASYGFDACMMDMYPTLGRGACLHIIPEEMRLDIRGLRDYFNKNSISIAFMTTQLGRQFVEQKGGCNLRALLLGGESLVPLKPPEGFKLYNLYGPTECSIAASFFHIDKLYDRIPIGKAVDNTALYVLDTHGNLAPVGVAGELFISGCQVAKGYLNRPDLTEEKFVKNPFSEDLDYQRMYKTGDVVRFLPEGNIDFVGRRDFQVKIRGFRVELTEIEGRIRDYSKIVDATVIAQDDAAGGKRVLAYIVSEETVDIKQLNAFIEEVLPVYMVPAATMQIDKIPLNQNGKINRKALPPIQVQAEEIVFAKTELQEKIILLLKDLIGDGFGITTDLMYAGLNSLSSIKAAAMISEEIGKNISTRELMKERTVEKIAAFLEGSDFYVKEAFESQESYPLTSNQLGLYFACIKEPGSLVYNIPFFLKLSADIDKEKLAKCITKVIEAHPYIKTRFSMKNNEPIQMRLDQQPVEIPIKKCTKESFEALRKDFVRPFNLFEKQLFRIEIDQTPENTFVLCDFHHIIFDGSSLDIFLRDLSAVWNGERLEVENFSSFDLALKEKKEREGDTYKKAKEYFQGLLGKLEGSSFIAKDKEGISKKEGEESPLGKPMTVSATVKRGSVDSAIKGMGMTASNHFLAAAAFVISRYASVKEIGIASIINGREGSQLQNNFGMLVKTLPTVIEVPSDKTVLEFCQKVQERMFETIDHQAYPFVEAASAYHYDPQIIYAYQGGVISEYSLGEDSLRPETLGLDRVKFPININVFEDEQDYRIEVEYDDGLWKKESMTTFAKCMATMAEQLAQGEKKPLNTLCIAGKEALEKMEAFNKELCENPYQALPHLFENAALTVPDKKALIACDQSFSYKELNKAANRLANSLLEQGIKKEERVAFMLPRDSRVLIAMLGIMKAGACYIPIDPDYPKERIKHILLDSGAKYILTDKKAQEEVLESIDINPLLEHPNEANPQRDIKKEDLCYIIYTSGSTGKPKGVMITHGNIINYVLNKEENRQVRALVKNDCILCSVTTVSFDMFLKEAFTVLMNGLTLVFADDEESKNPVKLAELFRKTKANAFNATPSRMLQYMELEEIREAFRKCKVIMAGGEKYPAILYHRLRAVTDAVLINTYGPTEITVSSNAKLLEDKEITIGAPLYNVVEYVMDSDGNPLPVGVVGELYIGGAGVSRGYFGNEKLTEQHFIKRNGSRFYKSGDLAKFTNEGEIVILGRNDAQIKLRGLRIELGEIENAIQKFEGIHSCAVVVKKLHEQEHLCAYYTAEKEVLPEELREALLETLTRYMVPTAYLQMQALPVTPNGKTDMKALPPAQLMQKKDYIPPINEDEAFYCEVFKNILHLEQVGATDNFFDLGGTSLLVTQVTIDANEKGKEVSYGDVFSNPTPRELSALSDKEEVTVESLESYDYSKIEKMLEENTIESFRSEALRELGNICLTGATGFLGIHVLKTFLQKEKGIAYCIVRGGKTSAEKRLKGMLVYYFSNSFDHLFGSRLMVVEGDITSEETLNKLKAFPIDTYINCAANVKHFSAGSDIEDINVGGTKKGIQFSKEKGCRFIQISTASVAGLSVDGFPLENIMMDEKNLFFGQDISNQYVNSKFIAERLVLEACLEGLDGKIMRVGNLMARAEDGEFQANFTTNSFLGKIKAYNIIKKIPYRDMSGSVEFAPIDCTADAVLCLSKTPEKCRIFHPYNDHDITMGDVIYLLKKKDIDIKPSELCEYEEAYSEALRDKEKAKNLNSLIAYSNMAHGKKVFAIKTSNVYTSQILFRLGFKWPITSNDYLSNFFEMMKGLSFFDEARED